MPTMYVIVCLESLVLSNVNLKLINDGFRHDYIYGNQCPNRYVGQKRVGDIVENFFRG